MAGMSVAGERYGANVFVRLTTDYDTEDVAGNLAGRAAAMAEIFALKTIHFEILHGGEP